MKKKNIYVADQLAHRIRKITGSAVTTIAGEGEPGLKDGKDLLAKFQNPHALMFDLEGNLIVSDSNHTIRKIDVTTGFVETIAGTGLRGFKDGDRLKAQFAHPRGLVMDLEGNIIICDNANHAIRKLTTDGKVITIAGTGRPGWLDGPALTAMFNYPRAVVLDYYGNIFITDFCNHKIRKLSLNGEVTTVSGTIKGYKDGPASEAQFNSPSSLAIDKNGNILIADQFNQRIRKIHGVTKAIPCNPVSLLQKSLKKIA